MPNWCFNLLTVTGEKRALADFIRKANDNRETWKSPYFRKRSPFSIERLMPTPEPLAGAVPPRDKAQAYENKVIFGSEDWYHWRIKHWGTKCDVYADVTEQADEKIVYQFDSAWSPPREFFETVSRMFPNLTFHIEYEEPMMGFAGEATYKNGFVEETYLDFVQDEDYQEDEGRESA